MFCFVFSSAKGLNVAQRQNDARHCNGYDKMKLFGFPIYNAVDAFSRNVLWLTVVKPNNNPVVPAALYLLVPFL